MIYIIWENKWVCDKIIKNWIKFNPDKYTNDIKKAKIIWLFNHYLYKNVPESNLPVVTTIHHLEESKMNNFKEVEKLTTYFHSISPKTTEVLRKYTNKKIVEAVLPVEDEYFYIPDKKGLRKKYGLPLDKFLIGSFQRDSEKDGKPKLEKGPDIFIEYLKKNYDKDKICVVLAGYNRKYLIKELEKNGFMYCNKENVDNINELYNTLDLYLICSRVEGGPRAILECALSKTPVISTDVGIAGIILKSTISGLNKADYDVDYAFKRALLYVIPVYMIEFNLKVFS